MSIEMFEHMRNWHELLRRVSTWLKPDGKLFVHVFSHRSIPYLFQGTWAAERFFTAGLMPAHDLLPRFQDDLVVADRWAVDGTHYARTLSAWLARLDARRDEALALLAQGPLGVASAQRLLGGWRLFLLSTARSGASAAATAGWSATTCSSRGRRSAAAARSPRSAPRSPCSRAGARRCPSPAARRRRRG